MQLADFLSHDVDPSDPASRDPEFIRTVALPAFDALRTYYFRSEIEGVENVPRQGPFFAVANHNGGPLLPDCWVLVSYWWSALGPERPAYAMVHDAALRVPLLRTFLVKVGGLRASPENAEKVLGLGAPLLVYPGGELDCLKSFWRRHTIDFHGRTGFIEVALRLGVPILPVVNVGGHEVYFTVFSSQRLARWSGLSRLTRVKTVPLPSACHGASGSRAFCRTSRCRRSSSTASARPSSSDTTRTLLATGGSCAQRMRESQG